jgi:hypothetical protein
MVTRQKLELEINKPVHVKLLYDECVSGQNQYGPYFLYAIKSNDQEYSYFANETVHEQLKDLRAGDTATITKLAAQRGNKLITKYVVDSKKSALNEAPLVPEINTKNNLEHEREEEPVTTDKYFDIMLNSYKDSLRIQEEIGVVDMSIAVRLAITLFIQRSR